MSPNTNEQPSTAKRQSCDRCHDQKLRCSRSNNSFKTSRCDRCLRKGARCVYSHSLPKGRPSLYRLGERNEGPRDSSEPRTEPWTPAETRPTTPSMTQIATPSSGLPVNHDIPTQEDQQRGVSDRSEWSADFPIDNDNQQHDIDMDALDSYLALPEPLGSSTEIWATLSDDYCNNGLLGMAPGSKFGLEPALEGQSPADAECSLPMPPGIERTLAKAGAGSGGGIDLGHNISGPFNNPWEIGNAENSQLGITHLSQLSMRLAHLLSFSRSFLSENFETRHDTVRQGRGLQVQASVESVFTSINNWLVCELETHNTETLPSLSLGPVRNFDLLHHAFSASDRFLQILSRSNPGVGTSNPHSLVTGFPSPPASNAAIDPPAEAETGHGSCLATCHLVLACITLLLNIYESILMNLQRCADTLHIESTGPGRNCLEPNDAIDVASRTHLQLVSVVQMCSYFIGRQNQTLDTILFGNSMMLSPPQGYTTTQPNPAAHARHLKDEVEQRLKTLKDSLQIVG